ncbi:Sec7 domain-containing protein, partial [Hysterangium stoloniferum]
VILQRLDSVLSRNIQDPSMITLLDDPPRKLLVSSSVTQVVDSESIRDRFLFLFNDILVVAKPFEPRLFLVKNIIDLDDIQVLSNRRMSSIGMRHPVVQRFIGEFNKHADQAVANLLQETGLNDDQTALGKLLFNTVELDRTRLGAYLTKKARRDVLKAYIDCFGFTGVRIDHALRTFILTLRLPNDTPEHTRQHLLETFAVKWFEVNSQTVTFAQDVARKLVKLLVHFDELFPKYNMLRQSDYSSHQQELHAAWERMFPQVDRTAISDEVVHDMYSCLKKDPLRWASDDPSQLLTTISFKRSPPNHLVLRTQSDPIILRIPHPDPELRIQLFSSNGLVFDPPELTFARSTEVAFRVTGTTLGPKSIVLSFRGAHAHMYQGITVSTTVMVERSFMRNTFQIAFKDRGVSRRRYMFSTED